MHRRGVLVSINSDSAEHARRLNTEAAKSMHWGGVSEDEALAFVTINPAKQLKIDQRVGSLEVGKDADLVIWNKHPLSTYAIVDRVYIDGLQYYDRLAEDQRLTEAGREKIHPGGRGRPGTGCRAAEGRHHRCHQARTRHLARWRRLLVNQCQLLVRRRRSSTLASSRSAVLPSNEGPS